MGSLKKGNIVRYVGKTEGFFTHNQIYEVTEEPDQQYFYKDYAIKIKDDTLNPHIITESYFNSHFIIE